MDYFTPVLTMLERNYLLTLLVKIHNPPLKLITYSVNCAVVHFGLESFNKYFNVV